MTVAVKMQREAEPGSLTTTAAAQLQMSPHEIALQMMDDLVALTELSQIPLEQRTSEQKICFDALSKRCSWYMQLAREIRAKRRRGEY